MPLAFFMDVHVPWPITNALRTNGIDVLTAFEDGTTQSSDEELMERSVQLDRVIFTQDDDFLVIAADWQSRQIEFPGVVYAHQLRVTDAECIRDLSLLSTRETDAIRSQVVFLPLPP